MVTGYGNLPEWIDSIVRENISRILTGEEESVRVTISEADTKLAGTQLKFPLFSQLRIADGELIIAGTFNWSLYYTGENLVLTSMIPGLYVPLELIFTHHDVLIKVGDE